MPLFLTNEEFSRCSNDVSVVVDKADSYIKHLYRQIETLKSQSDASSIIAEQTCSLLEQKYVSLTSDFAKLEAEKEQLAVTLEQRISQVAELQSQKHQLHLKSIGRDGDVERLSIEVSELHKSNRQLLGLIKQRDMEITEKNSTLKTYLEKIVKLTDNGSQREARFHDIQAEIARSSAVVARLSQEKELIERHNVWLNDELTGMANSLNELRRSHNEHDSQMSSKLANVQREYDESSKSLKLNEERVRVLEASLTSMQEELCSHKDVAAANEERYSAEISTVTKLIELYKESSEEWSTKAGELEGVIRALETHSGQFENDFKEKLEKEVATRNEIETDAKILKDKLEKCEAEIESNRKSNELSLVPFGSYGDGRLIRGAEDEIRGDTSMIVPKILAGVSGTALAASLLRDGWSLAKMYEKFQEASDALHHERLGRKQSQDLLEKVLFEIEEKSEVILDERAEHERMVEAYTKMDQKLHQSLSEQVNIEGTIQNLKADLRRQERENGTAQKEIADLQKQVTVLLKECRDIQLRFGSASHMDPDDYHTNTSMEMSFDSDVEKVISERLLTFKDINELVEQNVQLRSLVRNLSNQNDTRDAELKERFEMELRRQADDAASKVTAVLNRVEEQGIMIESLHNSVAMYKRLYKEEEKRHDSHPHSAEAVPEHGRKDLMLLLEGSQEASKKAHAQAVLRARHLEEEMAKARSEIISVGLQRDKLAMEVNFARDRLDSFMKEFDHQREETISVKARNMEFSQLIVEYQRKLRDSYDSVIASEELSRKLTMDVSILKHEKEMLLNSDKRASQEVLRLSERVHRLQASLDIIQSAEEVREEARSMERRRQEEQLNRAEREWAEAKRELQEERDTVRSLTLVREQTIKHAMRQVEEIGKQLADALHAVAAAEARAAVAEARCSNLEASIKSTQNNKELEMDRSCDPSISSTSEDPVDLLKAKQEMGKLKEEAKVNKEHMLQYKSIAQVNEAALKQIESAHAKFKSESEKLKKLLEAEIISLRERVSELENDCVSKSKEVVSAVRGKEEALDAALAEISNLKEDISLKTSKIMAMELQLTSLKEDLGKENERWHNAQNNYERQVILQSDTIQELTKTSQALGSLQQEASELRKLAEARKNEFDILKATWETEKAVLDQLKNESEKNYAEINEQNKILHNHLEALHMKVAEKERNYFGGSSGSTDSAQHVDFDLQKVVHYLRRSKEIAETEISLLKQVKLRLQSQLESALKASETVQSLLQSERANSRSLLFSDEEFKSLQTQVREINLLRESNIQLREENKNNFEECQKLREIAQKARIEVEQLETLLREKQISVESNQKEIVLQKIEKDNMEKRLLELLEKGKNIDLEDYERAKDGFQKIQVKLREKEAELGETKRLVAEKQDTISRLEHDLANSRSELNEKETRTNNILQIEAKHRTDLDKQKVDLEKLRRFYKKKIEALTKENEELVKEKQSHMKQLEDSKQGKRPMDALAKENEELIKEKQSLLKQLEDFKQGNSANDQAMTEKDMRIQVLVSTMDKERAKRVKTEKTVENLVKNVAQEKKGLVDELAKYKRAREQLQESTTISASQLPPENVLDDHMTSYQAAVENLEVEVDSLINEAPAEDVLPVTASPVAAGRQIPSQVMSAHTGAETAIVPSQTRPTDDREKRPISKPNVEALKMPRRLVRPRLARPKGAGGDVEMSEVEASSNNAADLKVVGPSHDSEPQANLGSAITTQTSIHKRPTSLTSSGTPDEENIKQKPGSSMLKKSKVFDSLPETISKSEERIGLKTAAAAAAVDAACEETVDPQKDDIVAAAVEETIKDDILSTTISASQLPPENVLDDHMASYQAAVENLEVGVVSLINEAPAEDVLPVAASPVAAGRQIPSQVMSAHTGAETAVVPSQTRPTDDRGKRPISKPNVEARRMPRRLVRPRLARPEGAVSDVEMSEVEASSNNAADLKVVGPSHDSVPQANLGSAITTQTSIHKRPASLTSSGTPDEENIKQEPGSSMMLKKSTVFDSLSETISENKERIGLKGAAVDAACEETADPQKDDIVAAAVEETIDPKRDDGDSTIEQSASEEVKDSLLDGEPHNEINPSSEELLIDDHVKDTDEDIEESIRDGEEQDPQQQPTASEFENDREEGGLPSDLAGPQNDSGFDMSFEAEENLTETVIVLGVEDEAVPITEVVPEALSPEILLDEKNEMGELMEETAENNDNSNGGNGEGGAVDDIEQSPKGSFEAGGAETSSSSLTVNLGHLQQGKANVSPKAEGGKEDLTGSVSPKPEVGKENLPGVSGSSTATVINVNERAKHKAVLRQAGVVTPALTRGQARAVPSAGRTYTTMQGRGLRPRGRGGRGSARAPEDKEQS